MNCFGLKFEFPAVFINLIDPGKKQVAALKTGFHTFGNRLQFLERYCGPMYWCFILELHVSHSTL